MELPSDRMRTFARQIETWCKRATDIVAAAKVDGWTHQKVQLLDEATSCVASSRTGFLQAWYTLLEVREGRADPPVPQE